MAANSRSATTNSARPGLPLPLELVIKIVKHCEEYRVPADDDDESDDDEDDYYYGLYDKDDDIERPPWITASASGKYTIWRIRLVCKQFERASLPSFGTLIGDRPFRFTRTGMQDLRNIAAADALVPWIKTLTFDTIQLVERRCRDRRAHHHYDVTGSATKDQLETADLDQALAKFMPLSRSVIDDALSQILPSLFQLTGLRFKEADKTGHQVFWITPKPRSLRNGLHNYCSSSFHAMSDTEVIGELSIPDIMAIMSGALDKAGARIQDLKLSTGHRFFDKCHLFSASLRSLAITIEGDLFTKAQWAAGDNSNAPPLEVALSEMKHLENLEIILAYCSMDYNQAAYDKGPAESLFQALQKASHLRQLTLSGSWLFWQASFSTFIQHHAISLRYLRLDGVVLGGNWSEMLHDIAEITRD